MKPIRLALGIVSVSAAILSSGCHKSAESQVGETLPAVTVKTIAVSTQTRLATEEVVGTVRPKFSASIAAKLTGTIEKMLVAPGQSVRAGEWLAQIDARETQARLEQAIAVRDQAKADIERYTKLVAQKAVTPQEFETVQTRERVASAAVREAETMLSYSHIIAPFEGIVTRKYAEAGDLAVPGKPLVEIENPVLLRFEMDVPEATVGSLKLGDKVPVRVASVNEPIMGVISELAPSADPISRTFLVKLDLPFTQGLRSGQFGRAELPLASVSALRVPAAAVVVRGQLEMVFVVGDRHAQLRLVKTGKQLGDEVEIVSGLSAGEAIVVAGANQLTDGQALVINP